MHTLRTREIIPPSRLEAALQASGLSEGARALLRGLIRIGNTATFRGGGIGLDYASLLKSAVRPDILRPHVEETARLLSDRHVDMLVIPGMSGYPVGTMYAMAAGIPALLLRKEAWREGRERTLPPGAFVLPSYTSAGVVLMTADPAALVDITSPIFERQVESQSDADRVRLSLRVAGADDIIDKATMARAASDSARQLARFAMSAYERAWRTRTGDPRPIETSISVVTWVAPLVKQYNRPDEQLAGVLESSLFAGLHITGIYTAPRAVGVDHIGVLAFEEPAG
ncbi:MAG TPA: hypothetical protein VD789_13650 [Thermomicrobiales bacterium]|nr:hypothetical protein [Thermomicrobiales bacterium]